MLVNSISTNLLAAFLGGPALVALDATGAATDAFAPPGGDTIK
jgi:hypothetical protein